MITFCCKLNFLHNYILKTLHYKTKFTSVKNDLVYNMYVEILVFYALITFITIYVTVGTLHFPCKLHMDMY